MQKGKLCGTSDYHDDDKKIAKKGNKYYTSGHSECIKNVYIFMKTLICNQIF